MTHLLCIQSSRPSLDILGGNYLKQDEVYLCVSCSSGHRYIYNYVYCLPNLQLLKMSCLVTMLQCHNVTMARCHDVKMSLLRWGMKSKIPLLVSAAPSLASPNMFTCAGIINQLCSSHLVLEVAGLDLSC